jgi:hypothetical protein
MTTVYGVSPGLHAVPCLPTASCLAATCMWHALLTSQTVHRTEVTKLALWASRAGWARCLAGPAAAQHRIQSLHPAAQPVLSTPIIPLGIQRFRAVHVVAMGRRKSYYAVRVGRQPGIYRTWEDCEVQVKGYSKAQFKGFDSRDEAQQYLGGGYAAAAGGMHTQAVAAAAAAAMATAGPSRHSAAGPYYGSSKPPKRSRGEHLLASVSCAWQESCMPGRSKGEVAGDKGAPLLSQTIRAIQWFAQGKLVHQQQVLAV